MSKPYFSVVMPAFGVEKYLENAVNSILSQTLCDCEIIIVDDASKDNSGKIADTFAEKHSNIKVIHHEINRGLSEARNSGLRAASGDFILFMDPDDTVEPTLFEEIKISLEKQEADVVVFGMTEDYYDKNGVLQNSVPISYSAETLYLDTAEKVHNEILSLEKKTFYGYAWNKVYRREYLEKIDAKFETVVLIEDIVFNVNVFNSLSSLIILNSTPYHYMKRMDESLTNKFVPEYFAVHKRRVKMIFDQLTGFGVLTDEAKSDLGSIFARYILSAVQRNCDKRAKMSVKDRKDFIRELYKDELFLELVPYTHPQNAIVKLIVALLKKRSVVLLGLLGRVVYLVKNKMPMMFSRVKQNR